MHRHGFLVFICVIGFGAGTRPSDAALPAKNLEPFEYEQKKWLAEKQETMRINEAQRPVKRMETRERKLKELQHSPDSLARSNPVAWESIGRSSGRRDSGLASNLSGEPGGTNPSGKPGGKALPAMAVAFVLAAGLFFVARRHSLQVEGSKVH